MTASAWYGNHRWPSGRNLGEFARDVFRLENCRTDREKALAFYEWIIRCFMRGPNFEVPDGFGSYSRSFHPLMMMMSFGHFECTGWGWVPAEALTAAGLKARRVVGQNDGHTIYEVFYEGLDGKAGWHAFDPFQAWYFLNRSGEVASCAEITADPDLVHDPVGCSDPLGYHTDLCYLPKRHAWGDALEIVQRLQDETLAYRLRPGMEFANLFAPAPPTQHLYAGEKYVRGSHCQISKFNHRGEVSFPKHEPYWANYRLNMRDQTHLNSDQPVRTHGHGALRWQPLLHGATAAAWADHAVFVGNTVRPAGVNKHCEVWYELELPYYASHLLVEGFARGGGSDYVGVGVSADGGRTIRPLGERLMGYFRVVNGLEERRTGKPSIQFLRRFHLRLDLHSHHSTTTPAIEGLRITVGYQHNMFTQPFILPGENRLWLEGQVAAGSRLRARWNYTLRGKAGHTELALDRDGRSEQAVDLGFDDPSDLTMRGIVLACEPVARDA